MVSLDYEEIDYRTGDIVKVDILVHHEKVDALAFLAHAEKARARPPTLYRAASEDITPTPPVQGPSASGYRRKHHCTCDH